MLKLRRWCICLAVAGLLVIRVATVPSVDDESRNPTAPRRLARTIPNSYVPHEWLEPHHLEGWRRRDRANGSTSLPMRIGLKQSDETVQRGHDRLMDISMAQSPSYGKHLTAEEVAALFAPPRSSVDAVMDWLIRAGIPRRKISQSHNKQWIQFDARVQEVEDLLYAEYFLYEHLETELHSIACAKYHVPSKIRRHVDYITPGIKLMSYGFDEKMARQQKKRDRRNNNYGTTQSDIVHFRAGNEPSTVENWAAKSCDFFVTPRCIRNQYKLPDQRTNTAMPGNELGIFQSLNQHYLQDDLDMYWEKVAPWIPNGTHPELRSINGAVGEASPDDFGMIGEEADLDFEISIPLIWPQTTVLFQTDDEWYQHDMARPGSTYNGFFNTLFDAIDGSYCAFDAYNQPGNCEAVDCRDPVYPNPNPGGYEGELMCGEYEPTNVIAISYSGVERVLPYNYMQRQCIEVLKLGLRGVTVVESSGDNGVGGSKMDRRAGCLGPDHEVFSPRTMSNCPYVLSVGATVLVNDTWRPGKFREVAATLFPSGGGFSNVFATPVWQETAVEKYFEVANLPFQGYNGGGANYSRVGLEPGLLFNKAGRGYPDVAAVGENMIVMYRGMPDKIAGTSVAVPIWGAILTLINEERLAANKTTVGFIAPVLYDNPEAFTDITTGRNPGCGTDGFHVRKGWDPVTGLGSPIYPKLLDVFMDLP